MKQLKKKLSNIFRTLFLVDDSSESDKDNAFQIENIDNKIKEKDLNNESSNIVSNKSFIEALNIVSYKFFIFYRSFR